MERRTIGSLGLARRRRTNAQMKVVEPVMAARRTITSNALELGTVPPSSCYCSFSFCAEILILATTSSAYSQPIVVSAAPAELS